MMAAHFEFEAHYEGIDYYVVAELKHDERTEMYAREAVDFEIFAARGSSPGYCDAPALYTREVGDKVARDVWEHNYDAWVDYEESRGDR